MKMILKLHNETGTRGDVCGIELLKVTLYIIWHKSRFHKVHQ